MKQFPLFFLVSFFFTFPVFAQQRADTIKIVHTDSIMLKDPIRDYDSSKAVNRLADSISLKPINDSTWANNPRIANSSPVIAWQIMQDHPYFGFNAPLKQFENADIKLFKGKESLFYVLIFLIIFYALLRKVFPKYFNDLFRLFFRTTLKQRQIREQLMQTPLPSLLLNGFFVICGGLYATFLLQYFNLIDNKNFWLIFLYSCLTLSFSYLIKFLGLKISGWLFNVEEVANSYIFIVFIVNKMLGIVLLPILVVLAFGIGNVYAGGITISWCLLVVIFLYRFILTYAAIHNQVRVNQFHFFLYLCAFEIAPLLLIYKGLLLFFHQTT